jgi:hypothetical protein
MIEQRQRKRRDGRPYNVWRVRWYDSTGGERSRTFDRAADAQTFEAKVRTLKRADDLSQLDAGKETLARIRGGVLGALRRRKPRPEHAQGLRGILEHPCTPAARRLPAA